MYVCVYVSNIYVYAYVYVYVFMNIYTYTREYVFACMDCHSLEQSITRYATACIEPCVHPWYGFAVLPTD